MAEPLRLLVVDDAPEHARMVEGFIRASDAWPDARVRIATSYDAAPAAFAGATRVGPARETRAGCDATMFAPL